jgi:hypothetical protein
MKKDRNPKNYPNRKNDAPIFESISVWKRNSDNRLSRYRCFRNLKTGRFSVQSCDIYPESVTPDKKSFFEKNYLELLSESSPEERSGSFASLAEAIEAHDNDFNDEC